MSRKTIGLSEELHAYAVAHSRATDDVLEELAAETARRFPDVTGMQVAPEQGGLFTLLVRLLGVRFAVEVGTFTGYSSLCIARGLPADGRLVCFDVSEEWTALAREYWERDGVADRIDLRLGDASRTLATLEDDPEIDFAFIDADKTGYARYYEAVLDRLAPHGVIVVDNVLYGGSVLDPDDDNARAIAAFNDQVRDDDRVDVLLLPIADGLSFITRR